MKKNILSFEGVTLIAKADQKNLNGGLGTAVGDCESDDDCPSGATCVGETCYTSCSGTGNPPPGCNEPIRDCQWPETGCGCVF